MPHRNFLNRSNTVGASSTRSRTDYGYEPVPNSNSSILVRSKKSFLSRILPWKRKARADDDGDALNLEDMDTFFSGPRAPERGIREARANSNGPLPLTTERVERTPDRDFVSMLESLDNTANDPDGSQAHLPTPPSSAISLDGTLPWDSFSRQTPPAPFTSGDDQLMMRRQLRVANPDDSTRSSTSASLTDLDVDLRPDMEYSSHRRPIERHHTLPARNRAVPPDSVLAMERLRRQDS